jgi:hypothetical protein
MKNLFHTIVLLAALPCVAQTLPTEMYYSADGHVLYTGGVAPTSGFYDKSVVKNVYLNFTQSNYWTLLTNNYASETNIAATMIYDGVTYPNVGVRFRGNTSYMQIGNSQKKSFGIDTDFVDATQTVSGYKALKFNNGHEDASFMREVLYNRMASRHMPVAKANFVHLYLNNQDWGIYPNIQDVNKDFLEEWFLTNDGARFRATVETTGNPQPPNWGDGTAALNYLGTSDATYQQYYSLKSNDVIANPWLSLREACLALSTATAANMEAVKAKLDIDKILWHLACENIFTDDDSYVMKGKMDYLVYIDAETNRTVTMDYDGNSTFQTSLATSTTWNPFMNVSNANYPLLNKLLNIPEWRQRYLAHYRTILNETFTTANATTLVNEFNTQIGSIVANDTKKLYTTAQYTSGYPALITFVTNRRNYLLSNSEVAQAAPVIASAKYYNSAMTEYAVPVAAEAVNIKAPVTAAGGINAVYLYYATGVVGNFTKMQMYDDGSHNDGAANDGTYGAQIPGFAANTTVRYYVEAIANTTAKSASYLPAGAEHDVFVYTVQQVNASNGVVINELMASNTNGATDEAGDFEDWVELYNNNNYAVNLGGYYLSDDATVPTKWQIPAGTTIPANGYLIVWCDNEATEGSLHATWKLSASGESVTLSTPVQNVVDQVVFPTQTADMGYARVPNGTGDFTIQAATYNANNSPLSTPQIDRGLQMVVYPNPASAEFYVALSQVNDNELIKVYNQLGQLMYSGKAQPHNNITTSGWASGTYLLNYAGITKKIEIIK